MEKVTHSPQENNDHFEVSMHTIPTVEHFPLGVVHSTAIEVKGFIGDFKEAIQDSFTGGKLKGQEQMAESAFDRAMKQIIEKAKSMGANAICNLQIQQTEERGGVYITLIGQAIKKVNPEEPESLSKVSSETRKVVTEVLETSENLEDKVKKEFENHDPLGEVKKIATQVADEFADSA